jgi:hypothetical protein
LRTILILFFILAAEAGSLAAQSVEVQPASFVAMPGVADSNSPSHWTNGRMVLFNSDGMPVRSEGESIETLGRVRAARFYSYESAPLWIEATYKAKNGLLYAWYHREIFLNCEERNLSMPVIGALRSLNDGITFEDFGTVLSPGVEPSCEYLNGYFGGGHGDFSVVADQKGEYLYFFYSNYSGAASQQGVAVARMRMEDLDAPQVGVWKYFNGAWEEPGLGGVETPVFSAAVSWAEEATDAFWGPSVHWNTYLGRYVMLLNRSCCSPGWPQEGIYVSYSGDLEKPEQWGSPQKIFEGGGWYPSVLGLEEGGTDKEAGQRARLFMGSDSHWVLVFGR